MLKKVFLLILVVGASQNLIAGESSPVMVFTPSHFMNRETLVATGIIAGSIILIGALVFLVRKIDHMVTHLYDNFDKHQGQLYNTNGQKLDLK